MPEFRLKIEIDVDALDFKDALEQGLDLLMKAPSLQVEVMDLETKAFTMMESNPDKEGLYG